MCVSLNVGVYVSVCLCLRVFSGKACEDGGRCNLLSNVILAAVKVTLDFSEKKKSL